MDLLSKITSARERALSHRIEKRIVSRCRFFHARIFSLRPSCIQNLIYISGASAAREPLGEQNTLHKFYQATRQTWRVVTQSLSWSVCTRSRAVCYACALVSIQARLPQLYVIKFARAIYQPKRGCVALIIISRLQWLARR